MSKTIYLIRHAQSSEATAGQKDIERELTSEGKRDVIHVGKYLMSISALPDIILSSNAMRAQQTADLIAEQLQFDTEKIDYDAEIYQASVRNLLFKINSLDDMDESVMLIGHNPALTYLAEYLTKEEVENLAPCGILQLAYPGLSWKEIGEGNCEVKNYYYPEII